MSVLEFLATAAVGSFLGVIAKELIDFLKARQSHRLELRTRFFDSKLAQTLRAAEILKAAATIVRDLARDSNRQFARLVVRIQPQNNPNDASEVSTMLDVVMSALTSFAGRLGRSSQKLESLVENEAQVRSVLRLFYGERWDVSWEKFEVALDKTTDQLYNFSDLLAQMENGRGADPLLAAQQVRTQVGQLAETINSLASASESLDIAANGVIELMRSDFKSVTF